MIDVVEASIADLRAALESRRGDRGRAVDAPTSPASRPTTRPGTPTALNAVVVRNPTRTGEAAASDARRARGETLGPLDGIPYTAKDSYLVARPDRGRRQSRRSRDLVAQRDAFTIERLRAGGAVLHRPDQHAADGQRRHAARRLRPRREPLQRRLPDGAVRARARRTARAPRPPRASPPSGSARRPGRAAAAPASNNALCAYTPSRGVISVRGNWPLVPTMDVVVPHTRTMADLLEVLDVIVADDPETRGDFWRAQPWVPIPPTSAVRPESYVRAWRALTPRRSRALAGGASASRACTSTPTRTPARRAPGHRRPDRAAHRDPRLGHRAVGGRRAATSRRPAPRSSRSTSRSCRTTRATARARRRSRPAGSCRPSTCAARSSTCRRGRGRTSSRANGDPALPDARRRRRRTDLPAARGRAARPLHGLRRRHRRVSRLGARSIPASTLVRHARARGRACAGLEETRRDRPRGVDGRARARRRGVPRRRRRRPGRHGRERGIRRSRLAQRRVGRQRQPRDPAPRHPDRHRADGHDGRHRHAGRASPSPDAPTTTPRCCALAAAFEATGTRRTRPPRTP